MKVWQEELQKLNRDPKENIRSTCRSASQFAKALGIYNEEMCRKAEENSRVVKEEQVLLSELKVANALVLAEKELLQKDVHGLREEKASLQVEVQSERETLTKIKTDAEDLTKKGYLPEVMEKIKKFRVKNGAEAIEVVQDHDKAVALRGEVQSLGAEKAELMCSLNSIEKKVQEADKKLLSVENLLDLKKSEVFGLQKVVDVVKKVLQRGYTPEQIVGVFVLLGQVEIQNQPRLSVERLVEIFCAAKNLATLKNEAAVAEKRLEQVNQVEVETKSRIELQKSYVLKSIVEEAAAGREAVGLVAAQAKLEVEKIVSELERKTQFVNDAAAANAVRAVKLEQTKISLVPLTSLLGLVPDADIAKTVPPSLVILLLENLKQWLKLRFQNAVTKGFLDPYSGKFVLNPNGNLIQLDSFITSFLDGLSDLMMKEKLD